jgi:GTP-dependent phosphoenolpyruvate carboxykinase
MPDGDVIELATLYPYAYKGRDMFAIVSPFRMEPDKLELIGRRVRIQDAAYTVLSIGRVTQGPIHKGEIVGIVVEPA